MNEHEHILSNTYCVATELSVSDVERLRLENTAESFLIKIGVSLPKKVRPNVVRKS